MSSLVQRTIQGTEIKPRLFVINESSYLVIAETKLRRTHLLLCYNMGRSNEERFSLVIIIPSSDGKIVINSPIPIDSAWILYCSYNKWVSSDKLPDNIWRGL